MNEHLEPELAQLFGLQTLKRIFSYRLGQNSDDTDHGASLLAHPPDWKATVLPTYQANGALDCH